MLILVRHGRTAYNAERRIVGRIDVPLDELGCRQAGALGTDASLHGARRVVTSPLARARKTAAALGPDVSVDDRWTEIDFGAYDGLPLEEARSVFANWEQDLGWAPAGGESLLDVGRRVREACEELWSEVVDHDVVVVSHVTPIKAAVCWALGVAEDVQAHMHLDVASICRIAARSGRPVLASFNETAQRPSA